MSRFLSAWLKPSLGMFIIFLICLGCTANSDLEMGSTPAEKMTGMTESVLVSLPSPKLATGRSVYTKSSNVRTINGQLTNGQPRMGDGSYYEMHSLVLSAGDRVTATMRSSDLDSYLLLVRVLDGSPSVIAENDDYDELHARISVRIEESGQYYLIANSAGAGETGAYQISVEVRPSSTVTVPQQHETRTNLPRDIRFGQTVRGELANATSRRRNDSTLYNSYTFTGQAGEVVEISLSSSDFDAYLMLTDSNGSVIAGDDDSGSGLDSLLRLTLPAPGEYGIIANCVLPSESGNYTLSLIRVEQAQAGVQRTNFAELYPSIGAPSENYALLVGIDDYPGTANDLTSCVTDTRVMRQLLIDHFGYKDENIVTITDADATRDHIIEAFRRHLGQAGSDGHALFYFSGHGIQMDGSYGVQEDEPDGVDEALYVWGHGPASSIILDDELNVLIGELNAGSKLMILDNCHAGTGTLGSGFKAVDIEDDLVKSTLRMPDTWIVGKVLTDSMVEHGSMDHILLAASKADETALAGSRSRPSVFTYALVREVEVNGPDINLQDYMRRVRFSVNSFIADFLQREHNQTPQLEGTAAVGSLGEAFGAR